jgi:hypothetical protein
MTAETRTIDRFAWFPTRLSSGKWIHLRWYRATEEWRDDETGWSTGRWWTIARASGATGDGEPFGE